MGICDKVVMEDRSGVRGALSYEAGGEALCGVALNLDLSLLLAPGPF